VKLPTTRYLFPSMFLYKVVPEIDGCRQAKLSKTESASEESY